MSRLIAAKIPEDLHLTFQSYVSNNGMTISEAVRKFITDGIHHTSTKSPIPSTLETGGAIDAGKQTTNAAANPEKRSHWFYKDHLHELPLIVGRLFPESTFDNFETLPTSLSSTDGTILIQKIGNGVSVTLKSSNA